MFIIIFKLEFNDISYKIYNIRNFIKLNNNKGLEPPHVFNSLHPSAYHLELKSRGLHRNHAS